MTVEIVNPDEGKKEEKTEELTREEKIQRLQALAATEPTFLVRFIEALIDHLRISEEDQDRMWKEALGKWYQT